MFTYEITIPDTGKTWRVEANSITEAVDLSAETGDNPKE
jgi:hypothetical protein